MNKARSPFALAAGALLLAWQPAWATGAMYRCGSVYQDRPCEGADRGTLIRPAVVPRPTASAPASAPRRTEPAAPAAPALPTEVTDAEGFHVQAHKGYVLLRNGTGAEACYFAVEGERNSLAWVPACAGTNQVAPGGSRRIDARGISAGAAIVYWWHRGAKLEGTDIDGADRVRAIQVRIP